MFPISRYTWFVTRTSEIRASVCHSSESRYQVCYSHVSESVPGLSLVPWYTGLSLVHLESVLVCHSSHGTQVCHSYIWNLYWFVRLPTSVSAVSICHSTSHFGTRFVTRSTSVSDCHSSHIGILFVNLPHIDISARPEGDPIRHSTHIRTRFFIRATWYLICHSSRVPYLVSHSKQDIGT